MPVKKIVRKGRSIVHNGHKIIFVGESLKKIKPDKFGIDDIAQQVVGAFIFSAPFAVTEEVWNLARVLTPLRLVFMIFFTFLVSTLIIYKTKFQKVAKESIGGDIDTKIIGKTYIPKRLVSLFMISYLSAFLILWMFGIIWGQITELHWIIKLIILVSFFSSIGAATADILK